MLNIILFCNGKAGIPTINFLINNAYNICVVVDPSDIGKNTWQSSLKAYCRKNKIPFMDPPGYSSKAFLDDLHKFKPTVMFSIQCKKIIKKEIIDIVNGEIFNFHFSDLPKNRGCFPGTWHLLNEDKYVGVTLHKLTEGIDDGPIIDKIKKKVVISDTCRSIYDWCCNQVLPLLRKNLRSILSKQYVAVEQNNSLANYYSRDSINFTKLFVDWNQEVTKVSRYIQAFIFPPFQFPKTKYGMLKINITGVIKVIKQRRKSLPGTILSIKKTNIEVQTKDGSIILSTEGEFENIKPGECFYL